MPGAIWRIMRTVTAISGRVRSGASNTTLMAARCSTRKTRIAPGRNDRGALTKRMVNSGDSQIRPKTAKPRRAPICIVPTANSFAASAPSFFLISLYRGMKAGRKIFRTDG